MKHFIVQEMERSVFNMHVEYWQVCFILMHNPISYLLIFSIHFFVTNFLSNTKCVDNTNSISDVENVLVVIAVVVTLV